MPEIQQIWPYTIPEGTEGSSYLFYVLHDHDTEVGQGCVRGWPESIGIWRYILSHEESPFVVELFEIEAGAPDTQDEARIAATLRAFIEKGSLYAWCMFDGVYSDLTKIFDSWHAMNTYALATTSTLPRFAFTQEERRDSSWHNLIMRIGEELESRFSGVTFERNGNSGLKAVGDGTSR